MNKKFIRDSFGWGFVLWLIGYVIGIALFAVVPPSMIGWIITPIGIVITLWVLLKKISLATFKSYVVLGIIWSVVAIICDYFLLVKMFNPADGYYKLDVYLYYILMFLLPLIVGWKKKSVTESNQE